MTRTDQLIHIVEATGSKVYPRESEVGAHRPVKALVLSLKQFHTHFYQLYEKGTTRAMVGFQGFPSSDNLWHPNVSGKVGHKLFCPWCFKSRGNTEMITTHLREVHYRLAIACNVYQVFTNMSAQVVLEHPSNCRVKPHKKSKLKRWDKAS